MTANYECYKKKEEEKGEKHIGKLFRKNLKIKGVY